MAGREMIGIVCAMQCEIDGLVKSMGSFHKTRCGDMDVYVGNVGDVPVSICLSGVGKVAAAVATTALVIRYGCTSVINSGVAGALVDDLTCGDVCVAKDAIQYDVDVTALGYERCVIPGHAGATFPCSKDMTARLLHAANEVATIERNDGKEGFGITSGRIASGDRFVSDDRERTIVRETSDGTCCDIEGASVVETCEKLDIPCAIIRCVSDDCHGFIPIAYDKYEPIAAARSSEIVLRALRGMD